MSFNLHDIKISCAQIGDMKDLFELANDATVRHFSFNQEQIAWDSHQAWFKEKICSSTTKFFLARNEWNALIGYVRFDAQEDDKKSYSVSLAVSPQFRGMGVGGFLLQKAIEMICTCVDIKKIIADVKNENSSSKKIFLKAGFSQNSYTLHRDSLRFVLERKHDEGQV